MNINKIIRFLFLTTCLFLGGLAARADDLAPESREIVIFGESRFLAYNGNNSVKVTQTFDPSTCIWEFVPDPEHSDRGKLKLKDQELYISYSETSLAIVNSFDISGNLYWKYANGTKPYLYAKISNNLTYYFYFTSTPFRQDTSPTFTGGTNAASVENTTIRGYDLSHTQATENLTINGITFGNLTIDPTEATLEYKESQTFTAFNMAMTLNVTAEVTVAEKYYFSPSNTETNYYYKNENGTYIKSTVTPTYTLTETRTVMPTCLWTTTGTEWVDIIGASSPSATIQYARQNDEDTTVQTVTFTANYNYDFTTNSTSVPLPNTKNATATLTLNKYIPGLEQPTINIDLDGTVTITHPVEGVEIRYTLDGSIPTQTSTLYSVPFKPSMATFKVNASAFKPGYKNSAPAYKEYPSSGVMDNVVVINDWEDLDWTYYTGIDNEYRSKYAGTLYAPDARNIIIEYKGGGVEGGSHVAISGQEGEDQNEMIYYQTMEKDLTSGKYPYKVIPNPFSKRPKVGSTYYGFGGWKIKVGADKIDKIDGVVYNIGDILPLDADINFKDLSNGDRIEFEAVWLAATTSIGSSAQNFSALTYDKSVGTKNSYETNFWVVTGSGSISGNTKSMTVMSKYFPDGTPNSSSVELLSNISLGNDFVGTLKIEFITLGYNVSEINPRGRNLYLGRGVNTATNNNGGITLYGNHSSNGTNQILRVESGTYKTFINYGDVSTITQQHVIFGCDYDRANNNNDNLEITGEMYVANNKELGVASNRDIYRLWSKSGKFMSSQELGDARETQSFYATVKNTHNKGKRWLYLQGGEWTNIAGGIGKDQTPSELTFIFRMTGGKIKGSLYGAGSFAKSAGGRLFVITGGEIGGWIAGGCNGVKVSGYNSSDNSEANRGVCDGDTYLYVGGNAKVGYLNGPTTTINGTLGGYIFGAGLGDPAKGENVEVGTVNNSNLVIADNCKIERDVYGGGNYGVSLGNANLYITGGTVEGKVFGGSNLKKGVRPNVRMYGDKSMMASMAVAT